MSKYYFRSRQDEFLTQKLDNHPPFLGADVGFSMLLDISGNEKTYLWLFGDTLIGDIIDGKRQIDNPPDTPPNVTTMNSIGLWTIPNNEIIKSNLSYYLPIYMGQPQQNGDTYGFFSPIQTDLSNNPMIYWPINALYVQDKIFVTCEKMAAYPSYKFLGMDILQLNPYPYNDPSLWTYKYISSIPGLNDSLTIGNATIYDSGYVYLYGSSNTKDGFVTRIRDKDFIKGDWINSLYVYNNQKEWSLFYSQSSVPKIIYSPLPIESCIMFHSFLKKYIMISVGTYLAGDKVLLFYSDTLYGPWYGPKIIYTIPKRFTKNKNYDWYAAKFHPEFIQKPNEIYWTYNVNSWDVADLNTDLEIYTLKMIRTEIYPKLFY
jgi:hypothetical protein